MKNFSLLLAILCFQITFAQKISLESKKRNLVNKVAANGQFGLMSIKPNSNEYKLFETSNLKKFKIYESNDGKHKANKSLVVFDIRPYFDSNFIFRVMNQEGNIGWVRDTQFDYSDLDLAFSIGLMNNQEDYYMSDYLFQKFQDLYAISYPKLISPDNPLINDKNKATYAIQTEKKKVGDSTHILKYQKLFFGYKCDALINEIFVDENNNIFVNGEQSSKRIKDKNNFKIVIDDEGKIKIQVKGEIADINLRDLSKLLVDFLDNGSGIEEEKCEYCRGSKDPTSSTNPQKANITIQNKLNKQRDYMINRIYDEIRLAYSSLWKRNAALNGITEFDKIDCKIRKIYQEKYPVNIIYSHRENERFIINDLPPPPPPAPEVIETIKN